jgi:hypothetical protein
MSIGAYVVGGLEHFVFSIIYGIRLKMVKTIVQTLLNPRNCDIRANDFPKPLLRASRCLPRSQSGPKENP